MRNIRERYDAVLNGVSIRSLSPLIRVTNIIENSPQIDANLEPHPAMCGQILFGNYRRALTVQITFVIAEIFDLTARAEAIDAVNAWAKPGRLEISYRPNKMLVCNAISERPQIDDIKKYTGEYTVTFAAYAFPHWVDAIPVHVSLTTAAGMESEVTVYVPGSSEAYLESVITPSAALTGATITADPSGDGIQITGASVAADTAITLEYSPEHFLLLHAGDTDLRPLITAASSDHILLEPQVQNTIRVLTSAAAEVDLYIRGVYA